MITRLLFLFAFAVAVDFEFRGISVVKPGFSAHGNKKETEFPFSASPIKGNKILLTLTDLTELLGLRIKIFSAIQAVHIQAVRVKSYRRICHPETL